VKLAAVLCAALLLVGCEPLSFFPGGKLSGETVSTPVADWAFTDRVKTVQLETAPADPYSVNVWCAAQGPRLWVVAARGEAGQWAKNLLADGRAVVRIEHKLYPRLAVRVRDAAEVELVAQLYAAKYASSREPTKREGAIVFRLDPRPD